VAVSCPIDFDVVTLRAEVQTMYSRVAASPDGEFHFHRGPKYAATMLGYGAAELAGLLKIEPQHLLRAGAWITPPGSRERSVEGVGGCRSRLRRGRLQYGRGVTRRRRWQLAQAELVETHRAAATTAASFDDKLERRTACERAI